MLYEDGEQTRDFSFVEDIARANLLAADNRQARRPAGERRERQGVSIREVAEQISDALGIHIAPEMNGEFRPGEMRHLTSGTERIRAAGYKPQVDLATGIGRYLDWIRAQARCAGLLQRSGGYSAQERHRSSRRSKSDDRSGGQVPDFAMSRSRGTRAKICRCSREHECAEALNRIRREGVGERVIYFSRSTEERLVGVLPTRRLLTLRWKRAGARS